MPQAQMMLCWNYSPTKDVLKLSPQSPKIPLPVKTETLAIISNINVASNPPIVAVNTHGM